MTTPPAALTSEKTKLFIHEPRGTRVILNYINHRGNYCSVGLLTTAWTALHLQQDIDQLHRIPVAHGFLRALGRGWNGRCGWGSNPGSSSAELFSLQSSALVGTGTGFPGRKPQDSTPGIFTVLRLESATRCCQPTPHIPAACKWSRIMAKLQWLVIPVFYLKQMCVLVDSDILWLLLLLLFIVAVENISAPKAFGGNFFPTHCLITHPPSFSLCIHCETTVSQRGIHLSGC